MIVLRYKKNTYTHTHITQQTQRCFDNQYTYLIQTTTYHLPTVVMYANYALYMNVGVVVVIVATIFAHTVCVYVFVYICYANVVFYSFAVVTFIFYVVVCFVAMHLIAVLSSTLLLSLVLPLVVMLCAVIVVAVNYVVVTAVASSRNIHIDIVVVIINLTTHVVIVDVNVLACTVFAVCVDILRLLLLFVWMLLSCCYR